MEEDAPALISMVRMHWTKYPTEFDRVGIVLRAACSPAYTYIEYPLQCDGTEEQGEDGRKWSP